MSPAAAIHAQLASIMEVLANAAVAEICELVDGGYAALQLEVSRGRKENDALRRRLRLADLRAARAAAMRAAAAATGGSGPRRSGTPGGCRVSNQEAPRCRVPDPPSAAPVRGAAGTPCGSTKLTVTVIKVEDEEEEEEEEESWSQPQPEQAKEFCRVLDDQVTEAPPLLTEAPPLLTKQEVADEGGGSSRSWTSGEVGSASESAQNTLGAAQRPEAGGYDCLMYEPQLQRGALGTQNPLREDPGCSYALNTSVSAASDPGGGGGGGFPFAVQHQQPAAPPAEEPRLPARKERLHAFTRSDGWSPQDGGVEDGAGKTFSCNFCGKTLACLKNLKTHIRIHTGEKPFVCPLCGKRFSDSSNLKRHQSVHTGEKRYGCVHCGKRFAQSGSLKVHMSVHTDCKQFRCSYCGKTFISGGHLRRHVTVHAGERRYAPPFQ